MDEPMPAMPSEPAADAAPVAPPPPPAGYSERTIKDLVKALGAALKAATKAMGREAPAIPEPPKEAFVKGKMMMPLPAFVVEEIGMLLAVAAQIGSKVEGRYDVDVASLLGTDEGLDKLTILLELFAKDKQMLAGLKEAQKAAPPMKETPMKSEEVEEETTEEVSVEEPGGAAYL